MSNELIKGLGDGDESWPQTLFQGVDSTGKTLWQFDKNGNLTVTGVLAYGSLANLGGAVNFASDFSVNTNKFNVTAASGNTTVAGTLTVTGASTLTGNVSCGGTLAATGASTLAGVTCTTLSPSSDVNVNTNKFQVTAASGNTTVAGTLSVTGAQTLTGATTMSGNATVGGTLGITGTTTAAAINGTNIAASGTLSATGASTLTGATSCGSTLGVTGTLTASGAASVGTNLLLAGIETALTAHAGGGQAAALALTATKSIHVVSTVGTAGDSVKLPAASGSGTIHLVSNQAAANSMQVFGSGTDTINGVATATGVAVGAGKTGVYADYATGTWFQVLSA